MIVHYRVRGERAKVTNASKHVSTVFLRTTTVRTIQTKVENQFGVIARPASFNVESEADRKYVLLSPHPLNIEGGRSNENPSL